ncbi:hypothetical protein Dimus_005879 [Dionaea muscipula]
MYAGFSVIIWTAYFRTTPKCIRLATSVNPPPPPRGGSGDTFDEFFHDFKDAEMHDPYMIHPRNEVQWTTPKCIRLATSVNPPPPPGGGSGDIFDEFFRDFNDAEMLDPYMIHPRNEVQRVAAAGRGSQGAKGVVLLLSAEAGAAHVDLLLSASPLWQVALLEETRLCPVGTDVFRV